MATVRRLILGMNLYLTSNAVLLVPQVAECRLRRLLRDLCLLTSIAGHPVPLLLLFRGHTELKLSAIEAQRAMAVSEQPPICYCDAVRTMWQFRPGN